MGSVRQSSAHENINIMRCGAEVGIVSKGITHVSDDISNPLALLGKERICSSALVGPCRVYSAQFVSLANTYLTPAGRR